MVTRTSRQPAESDDGYFMRVYRVVKAEYPDCPEVFLFYGVCNVTELPCLHPFPLREYHGGLTPGMKLVDFLDTEPPERMKDRGYRNRAQCMSYCPVCITWNPMEPKHVPGVLRRRMFEEAFHKVSEAASAGGEDCVC